MTHDLYPLLREAMQAFSPYYSDAMQAANDAAGFRDHDWSTLFASMGLDPQPISAAELHNFQPYVTVESLEAPLSGAASRGLLERAGDGAYRMTDAAHEGIAASFAAAHRALATLEPLRAAEMRRLVQLLEKLVAATLAAPEPAAKRNLRASRLTDPGQRAGAAAQIDQYLTDLLRFRDDAHVAVWRSYDVAGYVWEPFTLIWRGEATTEQALHEQLARRQQPAEIYHSALRELDERGWIRADGGSYAVTKEGNRSRDEAERLTDELYYAPWSTLNQAEIGELGTLLTQLSERLREAPVSV
jgi:hypothetical protein